MLWRLGQHLLGRGDIEGDVALTGLLLQQFPGEARGVGKGMAEQQAAPAAVKYLRLIVEVTSTFGQAGLQALVRRRLTAQQAQVQ
ncbi:hypothetical protein FQZ97_679690 [compost metagenome]